MKKGRAGTMTHDYKRHGTTTLFAALDVLEGRVIGQCMARHRHQEFLRFLNKINRETAAERELHLIVDNYATHKHPKVRAWLERHPRFHFHFTPTVNRSTPVLGRSDSNTDRPLGRLAPQGVSVWPDPHSDRPTVSFLGPVGRPGTPCGEALPRRCL